MKVQILGTGCSKCKVLTENVAAAVAAMGTPIEVEKVEDPREIARYGVMSTPALVVDGEVKLRGRVASSSEIKLMLAG